MQLVDSANYVFYLKENLYVFSEPGHQGYLGFSGGTNFGGWDRNFEPIIGLKRGGIERLLIAI